MRLFWKMINYLYVGFYASKIIYNSKVLKFDSFKSDEDQKIIIMSAFFAPFMTVLFPILLAISILTVIYIGTIFIGGIVIACVVIEYFVCRKIFWGKKLYTTAILEYERLSESERKSRSIRSFLWFFGSLFGSPVIASIFLIVRGSFFRADF